MELQPQLIYSQVRLPSLLGLLMRRVIIASLIEAFLIKDLLLISTPLTFYDCRLKNIERKVGGFLGDTSKI